MNSRFELMKKIQELHFTLIDSGLYLNAYDCDEAHEYGKMIHQKYKEAVNEYNNKYGPLTSCDSFDQNKWNWVCTPWPWELEANC